MSSTNGEQQTGFWAEFKRIRTTEAWQEFSETVSVVVQALLIDVVVRSFLFQPFNIPSGSMIPTLLIGDYLFVSKYAYGYSKHSFPFSPDLFECRIMASDPVRGDVVVFKFPQDNSTDFIKRVIGLPGDKIQMINDVLYLNGKPVPRERVANYVGVLDGEEGHWTQYRETLPGGKSYVTLDKTKDGPLDNTELFVVPPGHYFMMGDNRDNSDDSREAVGYVPADNLEGKALFRFFSTDGSARFWEVWKWPFAVRYSRILTLVK